jgi:uncharacterized protein (DUF885 family)
MRAMMVVGLALAAIPAMAPAATPKANAPQSADARLKALYDSYWLWAQADDGRIKDGDRWVGAHLPDVSPIAQDKRIARWRETMATLDTIPVAQLSPEEKLNAAVFREVIRANIARAAFRDWEMPFNSDSNFWSDLARERGTGDTADYQRAIARMRDIPIYFDQQIANMRAGLKRGFSVPRATLDGRADSIVPYADADLDKNPFYASFKELPKTIPAAEQDRLRAEAKAAITQSVIPAYAKLLTFIRDEYVPQARTDLAAEAMPDGKAFYATQIREYTTLDLTAEQIHEIGLKEVARIEAEMKDTMVRSGFKGSFEDYLTFLKTDPQFKAKTPDELMGISSYVAKRVDGKLAEEFALLPRYRFTIIPVPDAIAPFYTSGRGGLQACMMNTYDLPSRPVYNIPALTLHECAPGHSFQAALALEQPKRPEFRRSTYFSGYGEGWGLYCEWLGREMGIYRNPYEEFGQLSYAMWRAVRLVIDTGIHHYGWSRQKAIDYLAGHTALSQHEVETEVDRYISWPGQALAYKLGEMTIRRLRAKAEAELGARFDKRGFHQAILSTGAVPLPVLEEQIGTWIAAEKAKGTKAKASAS